MKRIIVFFVLPITLFYLSSCQGAGYQEGYNAGYEYGYKVGHKDGYASGYSVGYDKGETSGYLKGTKFFVADGFFPTLGGAILIIIGILFIILMYILFKNKAVEFFQKLKQDVKKKELLKRMDLKNPDLNKASLHLIEDLRVQLASVEIVNVGGKSIIAEEVKSTEVKLGLAKFYEDARKIENSIEQLKLRAGLLKLDYGTNLYKEVLNEVTKSRVLSHVEKLEVFKRIEVSLGI